MKKLFIISMLAFTAGLHADYANQGFYRMGSGQSCCAPEAQRSSMPYTTIVNEEDQGQGSRQQYYYYGSDSQRDNNDNNNYYNRDNVKRNLRDRAANFNRDDARSNIQQRVNAFRNGSDDRNQNTFFNRNSATNGNQNTYFNRNDSDDRNQNTYFNGNGQQAANTSDTFGSDSDRALGRKVRDAIKGGWFSRGYEQVSLDVNNGIVTLRGFVVSLDDKKKVEDAVKNVSGVNNVRNQLSISEQADGKNVKTNGTTSMMNRTNTNSNAMYNNDDADEDEDEDDNDFPQDRASSESDRQINKKIRDAISNGWFAKKYEAVVIRTDKGIVTIEGFVDSFDDQRKINDQIRKVEGVRSVNNNVQVKDKNS